MLDLNKPVQTRDGKKTRIICTDRRSPSGTFPIVALIESNVAEYIAAYTKEGRYYSAGANDMDLVNIKTPRKHADIIKAWADGAEVQCRYSETTEWETLDFPTFDPCAYYRVKP